MRLRILALVCFCFTLPAIATSAASLAGLPQQLVGQINKVTASDGVANDYFGWSMSISGDTAVVGAYQDDDDGSKSGSAYVFERDFGGPDNWGEVKKLTASDAHNGDQFGWSVSISGDTVVVGALFDDDAGSASGSAYVFERNSGGPDNWGEVKKLTASDAVAQDRFGVSVSISGDHLIVGAYGNDDAGSVSGSAYVFERYHGGAGTWGEVKKLTASDAHGGDRFGYSVSISGDYLIVSAHRNDDAGGNAGSAYIFEKNFGGTDNWGEVKKLTASDAAGGDQFGFSLSISGETAVVGAFGNDDAGSGSGSAYVFERSFGGIDNWGEVQKLTASDAAPVDQFGHSVAISGDTVVVGAYLDDDVWRASGSAYIFERNSGGFENWGETQKLTASDAAETDRFGWSVAISGDTLIVGASQDDDVGGNAGSAYLFAAP